MVTVVPLGDMPCHRAGDFAAGAHEIDNHEVAGLADALAACHRAAQRFRYRGAGVEKVDIDAARAVMAGSERLGDTAVLARPPDAPFLHLADAGGTLLAQEACEALVAQAAARFERVIVVKAPVVRRLRTERHGDGHLRHHGGAAAADQAAVGEQDPQPARAASIAAYMPAPPDPMIRTSVSTCLGAALMPEVPCPALISQSLGFEVSVAGQKSASFFAAGPKCGRLNQRHTRSAGACHSFPAGTRPRPIPRCRSKTRSWRHTQSRRSWRSGPPQPTDRGRRQSGAR